MDIFLSIMASLGGSTVILGGLFGWLGKRYLDKYLEVERKRNQEDLKKLESVLNKEIELHKTHLKYDEIFFKALYNSSQDLYKIRTNIFNDVDVLPNWEWEDACAHIATKFAETESALKKFLENYYTSLPPEIFENLERAKFLCKEGESEISRNTNIYAGYNQASELWDILNDMSVQLKSSIDEKRIVEFQPINLKKHNNSLAADARTSRG